jgi:hypothetical protein
MRGMRPFGAIEDEWTYIGHVDTVQRDHLHDSALVNEARAPDQCRAAPDQRSCNRYVSISYAQFMEHIMQRNIPAVIGVRTLSAIFS